MSRLTKYLKQEANFQAAIRDINGKAILNAYGEPEHKVAVTVKCRKDTSVSKSATGTGEFISVDTMYIVDETIKPQADDLFDGKVVLSVDDYAGGKGEIIGYEVHV